VNFQNISRPKNDIFVDGIHIHFPRAREQLQDCDNSQSPLNGPEFDPDVKRILLFI